jgi:hypothetical protein
MVGSSGRYYNPKEAISREQVIRAYTYWSAFAEFAEKEGVQLNDDQAARIPFHNRCGCRIWRKARTQRSLALRRGIGIKPTAE